MHFCTLQAVSVSVPFLITTIKHPDQGNYKKGCLLPPSFGEGTGTVHYSGKSRQQELSFLSHYCDRHQARSNFRMEAIILAYSSS